jgi:hypothetical protein
MTGRREKEKGKRNGKEASFAHMILGTSHVSLLRRTPLATFFNRPKERSEVRRVRCGGTFSIFS